MISIQSQHLRRVDIRRDLLPVADLIELCFGSQMDKDGREYVQQIRRAAKDSRYLRWMPGAGEQVSLPLHGYVWEEGNRIVGNLTLIPNYYKGCWYYLIANVAVHPDFRRRGIARQLTETALHHVRDHNAHAAWLHVREDNFAAQELYRSLGMVERVRRTTWCSSSDIPPETPPKEITITRRVKSHWRFQNQWLDTVYPQEIVWNMPLQPSRFNPGLWAGFIRFLNNEQIQHWSALYRDELAGVVTWEPSRHSADTLWLAVNPQIEQEAIQALLTYLRQTFSLGHPLQTNYPAGRAENAFHQAGFGKANTLIWMEMKFR
ncbi:MAG: GNAT family N-acetyltransferase [Anaerolineae bacterium]|nr:GNAT family N-acetyltransferase [Anaerolineae bacterium]